MKHISFEINNEKEYLNAINECKNPKYKECLIQVFTSIIDKSKIQEILDKLNKDFPTTKIVGVTTAGEISHGKIYNNSVVISISLFEKTKIEITYLEEINYKAGEKISNICNLDTKAILLLSEGLKGENYEGLILGIEDRCNNILIAGGLAGDNFKLKETFIFYQNKIYNKGALAISFSNKDLIATNRYNLNWIPIGKEFIVTKAEKNILKEINKIPAKKLFEKYLGKEIFEQENYLLNFQLLYKEGSITVSRTPMKVEGDNIILAGPIKEGQIFQIGFSNASNVFTGIKDIEKEIYSKDISIEGIYIYSCIARKTLLGEKILESTEFNVLENIAPTAGFFTYGEFFSGEKTNSLLNCTTTILGLSETSNHTNKNITPEINISDITFTALTHFISQTSKELLENEEILREYKEIVDKTEIVSKTDKNGIITYVNDNFCKISKYSKEELIGKNHSIVRDPKVPSSVFKNMWKTILKGKLWKGVLSNRAKDGSIYYVDTAIMPIKRDGEIVEFIAIRKDITKQLKTKKKILEKEKLIRAILDNQESIVIYSKNDTIMNANKKFFEVFKYENIYEFKKEHQCICEFFIKEKGYIHPDFYPNWLDDIAENRLDFIPKAKIKIDNQIRIFNIMVKKIEDGYIINLNDITKLEEAIQKAYASEKAKSIFLANMSHEIRTPLNAIIGFTSILTKKDLGDEANKYIGIIHRSSKSLLNIVNDILDFSKLESGKVTISPQKANFITEIKDTIMTFSSICKQKNINYKIYIDKKIPKTLYCDIQRIKQVLSNLISNAVKFTPENGEIEVRVELKEIKNNKALIHFSVKDSGIGIPKEKIKTIFKPFAQADETIGRKFGGTGLGLAISQEFIRLMGSEIKIKSEVNKGSEFYFDLELPIINEKENENNNENKDMKFNGYVLVAEDDPTNQMLISILLKERGIKYKMANNGKEAIEYALEEDFDVIFMDIKMPIIDGLKAIKELRKRGYNKPIISLSANVLKEDKEEFLKAGADDTLNKPIIPEELDKVLSKYLNYTIENRDEKDQNKKQSIYEKIKNIKDNIKSSVANNIENIKDNIKIKYDSISIDKIKEQLHIDNINIIKNLLKSFKNSILNQIKKIEEKGLDKDTLHTIKGLTGNLRLNNIYELSMKFEKEIDNWDKSKYNSNTKLILNHLKNILKEIEKVIKE